VAYITDEGSNWSRKFPLALHTLGLAYLAKGMHREAIESLGRASALDPDNPILLSELGRAYAASGDRAEAARILQQLSRNSEQHYVAPESFVAIHVGLGDTDEVFRWLEKKLPKKSSYIVSLNSNPSVDLVRADPRFDDLLRRGPPALMP